MGHENAILCHVTLIPYLRASQELKTKPTQASVKELQGMGIQPDIIVCRSEQPLDQGLKDKIALFCNVPNTHVLQNLDVEYLYEAGKDSEAAVQLKRIDDFLATQDIVQDAFSSALSSAQFLETDLMEVYSHSPCCKECAKYVNRIYSISGKDRRFPPLKDAARDCQHELRCLSFTPFVYGVHEPTFECKNIIKYSNRPFRDERTREEIRRYDDCLAADMQRREDEAKQEARMIENAKTKRKDMQTLQWLQENLPSIAPKSLSGFRRMRTTNSKNYQKLVAEARKLGKEIEQ